MAPMSSVFLFGLAFCFCDCFNLQYQEDVCSNATAGNYDEATIQGIWKDWIENKFVKISCETTTTCSGVPKDREEVLTKDDVGKQKHAGKCSFLFPKGSKTFGEILKVISGIQPAKILSTEKQYSLHHSVKIQLSDFIYEFNVKLAAPKGGAQLVLSFLQGGELSYQNAAKQLDERLRSKPSPKAQKTQLVTMCRRIREMFGQTTAYIKKWKIPSKSDPWELGHHLFRILDWHMLAFVAESAIPLDTYVATLKDICTQKRNGLVVDKNTPKQRRWLAGPRGRMPEVFQKFLDVQEDYFQKKANDDNSNPTFIDLLKALNNSRLPYQYRGGAMMQRVQFISDLFDCKWSFEEVKTIAEVKAPAATQTVSRPVVKNDSPRKTRHTTIDAEDCRTRAQYRAYEAQQMRQTRQRTRATKPDSPRKQKPQAKAKSNAQAKTPKTTKKPQVAKARPTKAPKAKKP